MKVIIELSPPQVGGAGHIDMEQLEPGVNIIFVLPCLSDFFKKITLRKSRCSTATMPTVQRIT